MNFCVKRRFVEKLKNPNAPENSRLKDSIFSLKYKIEDLKNKLDDLV